MKISVLIPAFHADPFIVAALESVRAQTHTDWELIVVEDGSRDTTENLVCRFAARGTQPVFYENLGRHRGIASARNALIELASGEAVAFLDADDTWAPDHLTNAIAKLERGADLVVSGLRTCNLVKPTEINPVPASLALVRDPLRTLFERNAIPTSSAVVMKRALALCVGEFDSTLPIAEDRDYWLRCALLGARFDVTDALTCRYSKHLSGSMTRTYVVAEAIVHFYEKYSTLAAIPLRLRRHLLAASLMRLGRLLRRHDSGRSATCLWRAWQAEPLNPRIPLHLAFTGLRSVAPLHAG